MRRAIILISILVLIGLYLFFLPRPISTTLNPDLILRLRLYRLLLGIYAGVTLAAFGLFLQGLLDNPLVEPYTLGIASGAALGVGIGSFFGSAIGINILAFFGALGAAFLVFLIARISRKRLREGLILAGIIVSLFSSGVVFLLMILKGRELHEILYLLMGYLGRVPTRTGYVQLIIASIVSIIAIVYIFFNTKALDIIASGYESAKSLGIDPDRLLTVGFIVVSVGVGLLVAQVGVIGFVGLIIPHLARLLVGSKHRRALAATLVLGAGFIIASDLISRSVATFELPVGVVTSIFGAPFFIYLMVRR